MLLILTRDSPPRVSHTDTKRVLKYGVRATVSYGSLREQTGENGFPRKPTGSVFCSYRNLRKPLGNYRRMSSRNPVLHFPLRYSAPQKCARRGDHPSSFGFGNRSASANKVFRYQCTAEV